MSGAQHDPADVVIGYHQRTKHHPRRYAASLGYLDWDTQPDPFRTYEGAPRIELPLAADGIATTYADLFVRGRAKAAPLTLESLGAFFELALGITAWKRFQGARWSLRANPSSGNLHPTECFALLPELEGRPAGVHHYLPREHALERRCTFGAAGKAAGGASRGASGGAYASEIAARLFGADGFCVLLSSIHWREAWKYGERAFRYCQHDLGHALASLRFAAAALGWSAALLDGLGDARVAALLGLDREEDWSHLARFDREDPETALWIAPAAGPRGAAAIESAADELVAAARRGAWAGRANALSSDHVPWDVIEVVAEATRRPAAPASSGTGAARSVALPPLRPRSAERASELIRRRRSAVALDGKTSIDAGTFFSMLDAVMPRPDAPPFDALPFPPRIHLGIFVHRVDGLAPGLYLLERDAAAHADLCAAIRTGDSWPAVAGCPAHLPFFLLRAGDYRDTSQVVSCGQEIAADGAFSLGMLASFAPVVRAAPHDYRRLFWEAGAIGQALYLEAEAAGVRATGIGCHFDDLFHELLGLADARFQVVYHFTVGGPVEDARLQTEPAYGHLVRRED